jgi:AcrR family transcriptional regulator
MFMTDHDEGRPDGMAQRTDIRRVEAGARPRDRKPLIINAAREMFAQSGYHQVGMDDIAAAAGLTGGALYRHFRGKRDLLVRVVFEGLAEIEALAAPGNLDADATPPQRLDTLLRRLAACALEIRDYPVLWQREAPNLSSEERAELQARLLAFGRDVGVTLGAVRSDLSPADLDFLVWANVSMFASPSYHGVKLPRGRFEELLYRMGTVLCATAVLPAGAPPGPFAAGAGNGCGGNGLAARASRRERLLAGAVPLFARKGYQATTMEDIGRAAGISGPSIYEHFPSKIDMLVAASMRTTEQMESAFSAALAGADDPGEALRAVVESHVALLLDQTDLFSTLITEIVHVPDAERHLLRRIQQDYVSEWVQLLRALRPDLSETEARVVTHAVMSLFSDVARMRRFRNRPEFHSELVRMSLELLTTPTS